MCLMRFMQELDEGELRGEADKQTKPEAGQDAAMLS